MGTDTKPENSAENALENVKNELLLKKKELEAAYDLLKEMLAENKQLKKRLLQYEKPGDEYKNGWTWLSKIVYLITKANKPLRSVEILEQLEIREDDLQRISSTEKLLSAVLNAATKNGRLIQYKLKGVRGYYYCLPHWIDEQNQLLPIMRRKIY